MSKFGSLLRDLRLRRQMTLRELGRGTGIDFTYICKVETGFCNPPSADKVRALAQALNVDEDWLVQQAHPCVSCEQLEAEVKRLRALLRINKVDNHDSTCHSLSNIGPCNCGLHTLYRGEREFGEEDGDE